MNDINHNADDAHIKYRDELTKNNKVQLAENGAHMVNTDMLKELHWLHGIEEYMQYVDDPNLEKYMKIKRAIMYGNIWYIKELAIDEIRRGEVENTDDFLNIILSFYTGYEYVNPRKVLQYISHCIDNDYIRKISSWSIKWQYDALLDQHFSRGQMKSKCWMVEEMSKIFPDKYLGTVVHYGGWYATVAKHLFEKFKIKKYYNLEKDTKCIDISDDFNYEQYQNQWQFKSVVQDVDDIRYDSTGVFCMYVKSKSGKNIQLQIKPDIIINTSCEHMNEDWFKNLPDGQLVCLQTNDYFDNEQHINCVHGIEEAKVKYPMKEVLYEGEIDTHLYNRFMLIGEK
tara:strand:- start:1642 stop:2664 length:1023 start_codon:yes stop_codon:yes gene_type:complete